jgi:hypothetical protein
MMLWAIAGAILLRLAAERDGAITEWISAIVRLKIG